jgi:hypothetical protein
MSWLRTAAPNCSGYAAFAKSRWRIAACSALREACSERL